MVSAQIEAFTNRIQENKKKVINNFCHLWGFCNKRFKSLRA